MGETMKEEEKNDWKIGEEESRNEEEIKGSENRRR